MERGTESKWWCLRKVGDKNIDTRTQFVIRVANKHEQRIRPIQLIDIFLFFFF